VEKKPNKLINELSPYLLQHAYNPVDWHPWNEETFEIAKKLNKPIFLSIGYSACHWCHVMEHESFNDPDVAQLMNEVFINIKVDREERPDIDHIYMTVCQIMTGSGGWPLTILMAPNKKPFFAGTYFPKESNEFRVGIKDLIKRAKEVWENHYNELMESADEMIAQLNFSREVGTNSDINESIVKKCFYELASTFESQYGGFSKRPKFPIPHNLMFLNKFYHYYNNKEALDMVIFTLTKMRLGGIYDHIGGGFHRYSTDQEWLVPHFEKMLYDQSLLVLSYLETYQITKNNLFLNTALETLDYLKRDMLSPEGAFYSAEDADSEGEEGKFYVWTIDEIRKNLVGYVDFTINVFNLKENGNYREEAIQRYTGKNILHLTNTPEDLKNKFDNFEENFFYIKNTLFNIRNKRTRPLLDDKILTDWNGLAIAAFAKAYLITDNKEYLNIAINTRDFILNKVTNSDYELLHRYKNGIAGIRGNLDDYAYVIMGLIELFKATSDFRNIEIAGKLMDNCVSHFYDADKGGFYFASDKQTDLIVRKKELYDGAIPSANSVMISNLMFLNKITNYPKYYDLLINNLKSFIISVTNVPSAYTYFVSQIIDFLNQSKHIIISGNNVEKINDAFRELNKLYLPNSIIIRLIEQFDIPDWMKIYKNNNENLIIYICKDYNCLEPVNTIENALEILNNIK